MTPNETLIVVAVIAATPATISVFMIQRVHLLINSRMTELLKVTAAASKAEGQTEERNARDGKNLI